jgi:hypothetical protein
MAPMGNRRPQLTAFRTPWVCTINLRDENFLIKPARLDSMPKTNNNDFFNVGSTTSKTSVVTTP